MTATFKADWYNHLRRNAGHGDPTENLASAAQGTASGPGTA